MSKFIEFIMKLLSPLLGGTGNLPVYEPQETDITEPEEKIEIKEETKMFDWRMIDWEDKNANVAFHFKVHETLWLPSWRIYHIPSDEEKQEIVKTADVMEKIRVLVNAPVIVHVWIRPTSVNNPDSSHNGDNYNLAIGSKSTRSAHIFGRACDFHISGKLGPSGCAESRELIIPHLEEWNIRMEDINGGWIHIDTNDVIRNRFFKP